MGSVSIALKVEGYRVFRAANALIGTLRKRSYLKATNIKFNSEPSPTVTEKPPAQW